MLCDHSDVVEASPVGDRWIPGTNGQQRGKCFRLMTSSWNVARKSFIEDHQVEAHWWHMHAIGSLLLRTTDLVYCRWYNLAQPCTVITRSNIRHFKPHQNNPGITQNRVYADKKYSISHLNGWLWCAYNDCCREKMTGLFMQLSVSNIRQFRVISSLFIVLYPMWWK